VRSSQAAVAGGAGTVQPFLFCTARRAAHRHPPARGYVAIMKNRPKSRPSAKAQQGPRHRRRRPQAPGHSSGRAAPPATVDNFQPPAPPPRTPPTARRPGGERRAVSGERRAVTVSRPPHLGESASLCRHLRRIILEVPINHACVFKPLRQSSFRPITQQTEPCDSTVMMTSLRKNSPSTSR
jgi:hypothetical protein